MKDPHKPQQTGGQQTLRAPSLADLDEALIDIAAEATVYIGTERGERAFERLAIILKRPALRIARAKLEDLLGQAATDPDDANDVANLGLFKLYQSLGDYKRGARVIPWFATMVRSQAKDFVRKKYHTRAKYRTEILQFEDSALAVPSRTDDVERRLDIQQIAVGLPLAVQQVLELINQGYHTREIAAITNESVAWVRERKKELRAELVALR